ncbi:MAG: alkaline phosphatase family protein [Xanthomonadales bacterium]|nr:alkaline phosphatase family protein [Xanthomonadales bacterium]
MGARITIPDYRTCLVILLASLSVLACSVPSRIVDYVPPITSPTGGINAPQMQDKPYLVLVSLDGFRWDYPDRGLTPTLSRLAREGVRAERLLPVFPTLTFPNHYSLVTGLYPARHGIVANDFPLEDGGWYHIRDRAVVQNGSLYHGDPLWVSAERQGMVAASFFWVGTEADIAGVRPTHWRLFTKDIGGTARVDQVLEWLSEPPESRPHFVTLYFEDVDDYAHWYGPDSAEADDAIRRVDRYLARLLGGIKDLPHGDQVNVVVVSDHGQAPYHDRVETLVLDSLISLEGISAVDGGSYIFLHFDQADPARAQRISTQVNKAWKNGRAWAREAAPPGWRVGPRPRAPDVILVASTGHAVISSEAHRDKVNAGDHGWRPEDQDMHGILFAHGPAFKVGFRAGPARNVDVHALLVQVLELDAVPETDSDPDALRALLR